jgi:ankyrin repeat protein
MEVHADQQSLNEQLAHAITHAGGPEAAAAIAQGADVNAECVYDRVCLSPLHRATNSKSHSKNLAACEVLLEHGARLGDFGPGGMTPFLRAVDGEHEDIVRLMLARGVDVNVPERGGLTALHRAADNLNAQMVALLLDAGANIEATCSRGLTPFALVAEARFLPLCTQLLAAGASCISEAADGSTPLHVAVRQGDMEWVGFLVRAGASSSQVPQEVTLSYLTPFQLAVSTGNLPIATFLASECGEDPAQRTLLGKTLLQLAGKKTPMKDFVRSLRTAAAIGHAVEADASQASTSLACTRSSCASGPL